MDSHDDKVKLMGLAILPIIVGVIGVFEVLSIKPSNCNYVKGKYYCCDNNILKLTDVKHIIKGNVFYDDYFELEILNEQVNRLRNCVYDTSKIAIYYKIKFIRPHRGWTGGYNYTKIIRIFVDRKCIYKYSIKSEIEVALLFIVLGIFLILLFNKWNNKQSQKIN